MFAPSHPSAAIDRSSLVPWYFPVMAVEEKHPSGTMDTDIKPHVQHEDENSSPALFNGAHAEELEPRADKMTWHAYAGIGVRFCNDVMVSKPC